jgi:hypothetical protein
MQLYAGHVSVDSQPCCSCLGVGLGLSFHGVIDGQGLGVGVRDHSRLCGAGNTPDVTSLDGASVVGASSRF